MVLTGHLMRQQPASSGLKPSGFHQAGLRKKAVSARAYENYGDSSFPQLSFFPAGTSEFAQVALKIDARWYAI